MKSAITSIVKAFIVSVLMVAQVHFAFTQTLTSSILPPAKTTFFDQNGKPLTSGTVDFYIPGSTVRKTTWQDNAQTVPNTNPVVLDNAGRALILGSGNYREVVKDRNGNLIWDQVTSSTGSGSGGGPSATGDGDLVGTIKPWAGPTAPNQYAFTFGQEVSRTTYAVLLTAITYTQAVGCTSGSAVLSGLTDTTNFWIGEAVETTCLASGASTIVSKTSNSVTLAANSNVSTGASATFFTWGRGNGTTTFNLPDFRGFNLAGNNNMGGSAATTLDIASFGATNPNSSGAAGGNKTATLVAGNLPPITSGGTNTINSSANNTISVTSTSALIPQGTINFPPNLVAVGTGSAAYGLQPSGNPTMGTVTSTNPSQSISVTASPNLSVTSSGTNSTPFSIVQPTKTVNYIIKVTPDSNSATASGVTSLGLMTGDVACGSGLLCTGNNISVSNIPAPTAVIKGGVFSLSCASNNWFNTLDTTGTFGCSQPSFASLTGSLTFPMIATGAVATAAQYLAGTASELVQAGVIYQAEVAVTFGTTTTFDFNTFINASETLTANVTTQTLSNVTAGKAGTIAFIQDATGSRTTVWNSIFKFAGGTTPSLTTTANAVDVLSYSCRSATFCVASLVKDVR